ncbi:signal peptidase II [Streptomyces finlayi]|uniref:Lipoprotein signal peptidase n=1 Tax=Streptomyces finlayi TaxID=67296 RepID=A0A7G7BRG6_9ACTN|nr:signal peptidase II [Streptomyces finlayi]QNE77931.1 signal peptidase II [Streptomyces finlayi]
MAEAERIIDTPDIPDAEGADGAAAQQPAEGTAAPAEASDGEGAAADGTGGGKGKRKILVLFVVSVVAYLLDLISKMIVVAKLEHQAPIEIFGDWLKFDAIRNAGAAFGFGEAFTIIFTFIAAAVIVVIARLARKLYSLPWAIALGLLLGGALGNLTDRIFRAPGVFEGAVVDFIAPAHFAVFNLADSAIVCGGILIVILSFKGLDPDGTVHKD